MPCRVRLHKLTHPYKFCKIELGMIARIGLTNHYWVVVPAVPIGRRIGELGTQEDAQNSFYDLLSGLLNRCRGQNSYRGFESPPLRQTFLNQADSLRFH